MPANNLTINGALEFTLGDSKMPPVIKWLEAHSCERLANLEEGEKADTVFAEMMTLMAKAHYGEDFEFDTCIIKRNVEQGIHTATFTPAPLSSKEYGDLMRAFEPPVDGATLERIDSQGDV